VLHAIDEGVAQVAEKAGGLKMTVEAQAVDDGFTCSICGVTTHGDGNNAWPINDGRCCDYCIIFFVLPERQRRRHQAPQGEQDTASLGARTARYRWQH
jgi:hypothetical protein